MLKVSFNLLGLCLAARHKRDCTTKMKSYIVIGTKSDIINVLSFLGVAFVYSHTCKRLFTHLSFNERLLELNFAITGRSNWRTL